MPVMFNRIIKVRNFNLIIYINALPVITFRVLLNIKTANLKSLNCSTKSKLRKKERNASLSLKQQQFFEQMNVLGN